MFLHIITDFVIVFKCQTFQVYLSMKKFSSEKKNFAQIKSDLYALGTN